MASIRTRKDNGQLFLDFHYRGKRCREQTLLLDTSTNRARLEKLAKRLDAAIENGSFTYADFFPDSPRAKTFEAMAEINGSPPSVSTQATNTPVLLTPTFYEFAELWFLESEPRWRKQYREAMRQTLDRMFFPYFGDKRLADIGRAELLGFRAVIAKRKGRAGEFVSGKRINKLMAQVKSILEEGCDRYGLNSPGRGIKPLKQKRTDVQPFTLEEVDKLVSTVRKDYQPYLQVRLLTGLRTGEANGLQWIDIDFAANTLCVSRTMSRYGDGETKTEGSKRTIAMVPQVREALLKQKAHSLEGCPWVFHSVNGNPIDVVNFTNRVWYPLLRHLALKKRPPYQMRHTAATLMLAAGENPEWVASVLGHSTTEMLFRVYSRFVPNLTRNDGRAFVGLLNAHNETNDSEKQSSSVTEVLTGMTLDQKNTLLVELTRLFQNA